MAGKTARAKLGEERFGSRGRHRPGRQGELRCGIGIAQGHVAHRQTRRQGFGLLGHGERQSIEQVRCFLRLADAAGDRQHGQHQERRSSRRVRP